MTPIDPVQSRTLDLTWVRHDLGRPTATLRIATRTARFRSLLNGPRPDEVGVYTTDSDLSDVGEAIDWVLERPGRPVHAPETIRVSAAAQPARFAEIAAAESAGEPAPEAELRSAASDLVRLCLANPVSVLRLSVVPDARSGALLARLASTGLKPARVLLDQSSIALLDTKAEPYDRETPHALWTAAGRDLLGLRSEDRRLLGGLQTPALIPPNETALITLADTPEVPAGAQLVMCGTVHAPLVASDDDFPEDRFVLVASTATS